MTVWCRVLIAAAGLPALAAAADPEMMSLVMPDASMLVEIDVTRIMASPVGVAIREGIRQGMATQLKGEVAKAKPEMRERIAMLGEIDWTRQVQDIVIAGALTKGGPTLVIVRSSLDPAWLQALPGYSGDRTEYEGVPILSSARPADGVIAFLDHSIVLIGQMADVKAAIGRRNQHTGLPAALAAQVARYSQDDIWAVQTGILKAPMPGPAAGSPAGQQMAQYLQKVAGFNGGLRFSPDFDLSADVEMRTDKDAAEMATNLGWLTTAVKTQTPKTGFVANGFEGLKYRESGRQILVSLHMPEEQVRAGLKQMQARMVQAPRTAVAARPAPVMVSPSSGLPPPPAGTIRVQSSEGTVLVPIGQPQQ
ncbi:MAG: hypothetical protein ABSC93_33340 [Bryobacteraceae bacterium]